jgi:hypothetical protein
MATSIVDGNILRVVCKMSYGVNDIQNTFHFKYSGLSQNPLVVGADIEDFMDAAYDELDDMYTNLMTFDSITIYNVSKDEFISDNAWPSLTAGTGTGGQTLPTQSAPLVLFPSDTIRSQGRKYLPPVMETLSDEAGTLTASAITAIAAWAADMLAGAVVGAGGYITAGNWNDDLARFAQWVSSSIQNIIRTQRRRVRGVGS